MFQICPDNSQAGGGEEGELPPPCHSYFYAYNLKLSVSLILGFVTAIFR